MAWAADQERRRIYDRTVRRRKELRAAGLWVEGPPPFGYRVEARRLVVVPERAAIVRALFARSVAGASLAELREWAEREHHGERGWGRKELLAMLRDRAYLGETRTGRGAPWTPGGHEPIVDRVTFDRAQQALVARRRGGGPHTSARAPGRLLRGLAWCALCGARVGTAVGAGGLEYYVCARRSRGQGCALPYARRDAVDAQVAAAALEQLEALSAELGRPATLSPVPPRPKSDPRAKLEARRRRLVTLAADGLVDAADLRARLADIDRQLGGQAEAEARRAERATSRRPEVRREQLARVEVLREQWARATVAERREVLALLADRVELGEDRRARITWHTVAALCVDRG